MTTGAPGAVPGVAGGAVPGLARCNTSDMKKRLPDAVRELEAVPKLIWLYIDRYPGEYSVRGLQDILGVHAGRALPALIEAGLLIEEEPATRSKGGKYRAVTPAPALEREEDTK